MVLPVHDENPTRRAPVVTYLLIAVNVVVFVLSPVVTHVIGSTPAAQVCRQIAFFDQWAAKPDELVHNRPLSTGATVLTGAPDCTVPLAADHAYAYPYALVAVTWTRSDVPTSDGSST